MKNRVKLENPLPDLMAYIVEMVLFLQTSKLIVYTTSESEN